VENSGPPTLRLAPIDVAHLFAERLWDNVRTAVLTSATIPSNLPMRLGLPAGHRELSVDSPFDYENQSLLYCATQLPDPRKPEYTEAMHAELFGLIKAAGGRTLALFTSWRGMRAAAEAVAPAVPYRVMTQDELPKPALLREFSTDETSCLFATMGFWQGVDVPGAALSLLVIDKLPFSRPDEPLMRARRDRAGAAAFQTIDLPRAASLLAQGAGRLIRSTADRGVVAVLDSRLATAGYRWELVRALPPMRRTKDRGEVERFLEDLVGAEA
jgi:ATP-dependent DNA helicase DinG